MRNICLGCIIVICGVLALWGGNYPYQAGGVSVWFPDNWKVTSNGEVLEAEAPTHDAFAQLLVLRDAHSIEDGVNAYIREVQRNIKRFNVISQGNQIQRNGLVLYFVRGEGMLNGVDVGSGAVVIRSPRGITLLITLDTEAGRRQHQEEFRNIIDSIRPL